MTTTTTPGTSKCTTPSAAHQLVPPRLPDNPRRLTRAANTRPGADKETPATGATTTRPGGGDNLHRRSGADRTRRRGLAGPERPGRVHLDPDSPVATLQLADRRSPHRPRPPPPRHHQGTSPPSTKPPARPNPDGPKWAQIWLRGHRQPSRHPTANSRTTASRATGPAAPPPTGRTNDGRGAPPLAATL